MVKVLSSLFLMIVIYSSCKDLNKVEIVEVEKKTDTAKISKLLSKNYNKNSDTQEYNVLSIDSLLLRGEKLHFTKKELINIWGKPDSTDIHIAGCNSIPADSIMVYYFKGVTFNTYNDFAGLESISFILSNETIVYPKIKINSQTKLSFFKLNYPDSYKTREEHYKDDNLYSVLRFKTHKDWDDIIILTFINKKLSGLSIWIPC